MNNLKLLFRQPVRLLLGIISLTLLGTFLCLSVGLYFSAVLTNKEASSTYTTIALPTNRTEPVTFIINGHEFTHDRSVLNGEILDWMYTLADNYPEVKGVYQQQFISAYSRGLKTLVSASEDGMYAHNKDKPYTNASFVITVEKLNVDEDTLTVDIVANVKKALLLHSGYETPKKIHLKYQYFTDDELDTTDLTIGSTYIVFGVNYEDSNLALKTWLAASARTTMDKIDWKYINYDIDEFKASIAEHGYDANGIAALYEYGRGSTLSYADLDDIDSSWMFIQNPSNFIIGGHTRTYSDGTIEVIDATSEEIEATTLPTISRLTTDIDTFLNSHEGSLWKKALEQFNITNQSVPVLGTDLFESMFQFNQKYALIVSGRSFTDSEYVNGSKVCVISEPLATANGLNIGDSIPMTFFRGYDSYIESDYNIAADTFNSVSGFCGEEDYYEVVGIYRQSNLWADTSYNFTPNTVFIPNKAITCDTQTGNTGVFFTAVLENGSIDKVTAYAEELGYEDIFLYFDQGYTNIQDTLYDLLSTSRILFITGISAWVVILLLFNILYVTKEKHNVGMMLSLGSGKNNAIMYILNKTLPIVLISIILSGALGYTLFDSMFDKIHSSTLNEAVNDTIYSDSKTADATNDLSLTVLKFPSITIMAALLQFIVFSLTIWVWGANMANRKPLELINHKEN